MRLSRGSGERQTAQPQPSCGTPKLVPVPRKVSFTLGVPPPGAASYRLDLQQVRRARHVERNAGRDDDAIALRAPARARAPRRARACTISSYVSQCGTSSGITPHTSASWRYVRSAVREHENRHARAGATRRCAREKPLFVKTMSAGRVELRTAAVAAAAIANSVGHRRRRRDALVDAATAAACFSISEMMRVIASTASRGYWPAAVSAESITASVPSRIALATSLASARVGRGLRDHRLEHLRRRDHRPAEPVARAR